MGKKKKKKNPVNRGSIISRIKDNRENYFINGTMKWFEREHAPRRALSAIKSEEYEGISLKTLRKTHCMQFKKVFEDAIKDIESDDMGINRRPFESDDSMRERLRKKMIKLYAKRNGYDIDSYIIEDYGLILTKLFLHNFLMKNEKKYSLISLSSNNFEHFCDMSLPDDFPVNNIRDIIKDDYGYTIIIDNGYFITIGNISEGLRTKRNDVYNLTIYFDDSYLSQYSVSIDPEDADTIQDLITVDGACVGIECDNDEVREIIQGVFNVLLYAHSKNVIVPEIEYNMGRIALEKKIEHSNNESIINETKKMLERQPEYVFKEIDSSTYTHKRRTSKKKTGRTVRPHWREKHWNLYWRGPKDSKQEPIWHYIPTMWVGDPLAKKPDIVRLITRSK